MIFSIIVPTYNRPSHVAELLKAWASVDFPQSNFEILLADDGGTVDLQPFVAPYSIKGFQFTLLKLPHKSASAARAAGLQNARGEFILCMDDDCRPERGILKAYLEGARMNPGAALGGPFVNLLVEHFWATATQEIISFVTEKWNRNPNDAQFLTFSNLVFPSREFRESGGYDPDWFWRTGEDRDVCRRWRARGGRMVFVPEAVVGHAHGLNFWKFLCQHFHYGQGNFAALSRRHSASGGAPHWSGIAFYTRLVSDPFRKFPPVRASALAAAFLVAQFANLAGFANAAWRLKMKPPAPVSQRFSPKDERK
jgi:glycosyltransferase involved in cell wall biosynthesis